MCVWMNGLDVDRCWVVQQISHHKNPIWGPGFTCSAATAPAPFFNAIHDFENPTRKVESLLLSNNLMFTFRNTKCSFIRFASLNFKCFIYKQFKSDIMIDRTQTHGAKITRLLHIIAVIHKLQQPRCFSRYYWCIVYGVRYGPWGVGMIKNKSIHPSYHPSEQPTNQYFHHVR